MFLTESYNISSNKNIDSFSLIESTIEAQEEYQRLTETMVVLEHKAIVTENATLLREAEDTFLGKIKESIKLMIQRLIAFFETCKTKIKEIALRIAAPLIKKWALKKSGKFKDEYSLKKSIDVPSWYMTDSHIDVLDYSKHLETLEQIFTDKIKKEDYSDSDSIKKFIRNYKDEVYDKLKSNQIIKKDFSELKKYAEKAVTRLTNIKQSLNILDKVTKNIRKTQKDALKEAKKESDKDEVKSIHRFMILLSRYSSMVMNSYFKVVGADIRLIKNITTKNIENSKNNDETKLDNDINNIVDNNTDNIFNDITNDTDFNDSSVSFNMNDVFYSHYNLDTN